MRIEFRTSGQRGRTGRGDLELVGNLGGYSAQDLEGYRLHIEWPDGIVRDTGLERRSDHSGKPRLRSQFRPRIQTGRIVETMLLMPPGIRVAVNLPTGHPILNMKEYILWQLGFALESEVSDMMDQVKIVPSIVQVRNEGQLDEFGVAWRWKRIKRVHDLAERLPSGLRELVVVHRDFVASGDPVSDGFAKSMESRHGRLAKQGMTGDLVARAEQLLGLVALEEPSLPPPGVLSEDNPEITRRSAHQYRLARSRGSSGRKFSEKVKRAYHHTCALCGARYGGNEDILSGIEAAHILAWHRYDLDEVRNGIALCRLHHWAFDAGVIAIEYSEGGYQFFHTALAEKLDNESRAKLGPSRVIVPTDRLPDDQAEWPSPKYIDRLYADLGVSLSSDS